MGGSASKAHAHDHDAGPHGPSPVRVSPQLLLKLAGQDLPESAAVPDGFSRVGPGAQGDAEKAAAALEETLRSSKQLRSALEHSTRVGDLLLKSEEAEVARVQEYAEDLLDHEYRAPVRPTPCERARQACVDCYSQHPQDVLRCADTVAAYKDCADQAFSKFVGR